MLADGAKVGQFNAGEALEIRDEGDDFRVGWCVGDGTCLRLVTTLPACDQRASILVNQSEHHALNANRNGPGCPSAALTATRQPWPTLNPNKS